MNILLVQSNTRASPLTDPYPDSIRMWCKKARKSGERETSLVACQTDRFEGPPPQAKKTYPIPYRVLNITCPLIVRGTSRSIWISYEEGTSILSCSGNPPNQYLHLHMPNEPCTHPILPSKEPQVLHRCFRARARARARRFGLKRRTWPTLNQNPPRSTPPAIRHAFIHPAHKFALLP